MLLPFVQRLVRARAGGTSGRAGGWGGRAGGLAKRRDGRSVNRWIRAEDGQIRKSVARKAAVISDGDKNLRCTGVSSFAVAFHTDRFL